MNATSGAPGAAPSGSRHSGGNAALQQRFAAALMPNYGLPPVALTHGTGCRVWDADGAAYLDLIAGLAVSVLGHSHPAVVQAVSDQVAEIAHTSNLFLHEPEVDLAERLLALLGEGGRSAVTRPGGPDPGGRSAEGRVLFTNSGSEAVEAALKLIRRATDPGREYIVATEEGFHGRTMGALALTGKPAIRDPFGPFGVDVRFVPYGDAEALRTAVTDRCAAVFVEPAQGEAGVVPAPAGYLGAAREVCDATGATLVVDEIQSGLGRTGAWFAHQKDGLRPDILTLAKGLGGGLPIGACIGLGEYGHAFAPGEHGTTFGGNPVACAAALAVLDTIEAEGLLARATAAGEQLAGGVLATEHPLLDDVRGRGLWQAVTLRRPVAGAVEAAARDAGFLVNAVRPDAIRLAPPLIVTSEQIQEFLAALPTILERADSGEPAGAGPTTGSGQAGTGQG